MNNGYRVVKRVGLVESENKRVEMEYQFRVFYVNYSANFDGELVEKGIQRFPINNEISSDKTLRIMVERISKERRGDE